MTPSNNRKHRAQQKTRPQGSNPGTLTKRTVHDNFMVLEFYARTKIPTKVRSCYRVSITSNQAAKKMFTKVPILKECHFGKVKVWDVEHFWTLFVFIFGHDC